MPRNGRIVVKASSTRKQRDPDWATNREGASSDNGVCHTVHAGHASVQMLTSQF
jgi:hypothetical protein